MYADEDSDVDMYEYESDNDEDFGARRGKRKRANARAASNKDEAAARPMEHPIKLQNCLKDGNDLRGRFSTLPVNGYASTYSMPPGWSCRKATASTAAAAAAATETELDNDKDDATDENNIKGSSESSPTSEKKQECMQEMAELLSLHKQFGDAESSNLRRSARETRPTTGRRSSNKKKDFTKKTEGLEYYLIQQSTTDGENGVDDKKSSSSLSAISSTRLDVEVLQEKRHEEYDAKMYQKYEKDLSSPFGNDGFGVYSSGSFPPYLGRVIPSKNRYGSSWEVRPTFAVPALRWVIRGLINSGHLTATEPMSSGGAGASNNDTSAGMIVTNDIYYWDPESTPFQILDTRVLQRKKRAGGKFDDESSEDEVEVSEYEKLRAERVARNTERLKTLGLA